MLFPRLAVITRLSVFDNNINRIYPARSLVWLVCSSRGDTTIVFSSTETEMLEGFCKQTHELVTDMLYLQKVCFKCFMESKNEVFVRLLESELRINFDVRL